MAMALDDAGRAWDGRSPCWPRAASRGRLIRAALEAPFSAVSGFGRGVGWHARKPKRGCQQPISCHTQRHGVALAPLETTTRALPRPASGAGGSNSARPAACCMGMGSFKHQPATWSCTPAHTTCWPPASLSLSASQAPLLCANMLPVPP